VIRSSGGISWPSTSFHSAGAKPSIISMTVLAVDEAHLAVDLRELRLAVGAEVLVAEAVADLDVAVAPATMRICLKSCGLWGSAYHEPG
jgi:hypothetical protein